MPQRGGTLVTGSITDIEGVNEVMVASSRTFNDIGYQMFLHLLDEQPDFAKHPPTFEPELATSYEWSDDHLDLTFHLRDGVVWSDGVPVTADDVRFTWEAQRSPEVAWPSSYMKEMIEDVEVVDPHTVIYHFSQVSPNQLLEANEGVILPEHAWGPLPFSEWRTRADYFQEHLVVDGPFRLERWTPQQEIVLVRNEHYFDPDLPYLDRVVVRIIPERSNQVTQLLAGALHLVEQLPQPDVARVRASDVARVESFWHRLYVNVVWNMADPRFADRRVRQALVLGVDRQQIVDTLWGDFARVADSPIVQTVWAHADGPRAVALRSGEGARVARRGGLERPRRRRGDRQGRRSVRLRAAHQPGQPGAHRRRGDDPGAPPAPGHRGALAGDGVQRLVRENGGAPVPGARSSAGEWTPASACATPSTATRSTTTSTSPATRTRRSTG